MAKKGGSGSSSSGSSSSCYYCNKPLYLEGWNWKSGRVDALFALGCISVIAVIASLVLIAKFKWARLNGARDSARTALFAIAGASTISYNLIDLVTTALSESETKTTYLFYITYIFDSLFYRVSEILVLAVVLKTVVAALGSGIARGLRVVNIVAICVIGVLTISAFGLYTARTANTIQHGSYDISNLQKPALQVNLAYDSLYFITTIYAAVFGFIALVKERSLATFLLSACVIPALFLRTLIGLAYDALLFSVYYSTSYYNYDTNSVENLAWALQYIYVLTTIAIFIGTAIVATRGPKVPSTTAYGGQQQKVEYANPGYANPGYTNQGYANPAYGNQGYGNATNVPHSY